MIKHSFKFLVNASFQKRLINSQLMSRFANWNKHSDPTYGNLNYKSTNPTLKLDDYSLLLSFLHPLTSITKDLSTGQEITNSFTIQKSRVFFLTFVTNLEEQLDNKSFDREAWDRRSVFGFTFEETGNFLDLQLGKNQEINFGNSKNIDNGILKSDYKLQDRVQNRSVEMSFSFQIQRDGMSTSQKKIEVTLSYHEFRMIVESLKKQLLFISGFRLLFENDKNKKIKQQVRNNYQHIS